MAQYERLIFDELQRIGQTYRSELEIARSKEKSLGESMASLIGNQAGSNEVMVQLRELERESDTFKNLYQTFLQRYQDAIQRETFPTSEARVISPAVPPEKPSSPKALLVFAASLLLGLMAGGGLGALRERRDRVFRIGSQVRDELGLELIGMLPTIEGHALPDATAPDNPRHVQLASTTLRHALDAPLSGFAEILRSVKVEIDLALGAKKGARIIGVVSVLPGEGKTTISKNLGSLLGFLGARTLLIDGDMRNPGLTRNVARHASVGLLEVLRGESSLADALLTEPDSNLDVLPITTKKRLWNSAELLSSPKMQTLLDQASQDYDYIVIDLPPIGPVVDVKAAAGLFDGFVFVVEWGKTARSVVMNSLMEDEQLYDKCVGVILNKVIGEQLRLYNCPSSEHLAQIAA
jgi:succinoglycan biosynthesis transport protein ExoP